MVASMSLESVFMLFIRLCLNRDVDFQHDVQQETSK
jgi:hypothetical protein